MKEQEHLEFISLSKVRGSHWIDNVLVPFTADLNYNRSWLLGVSDICVSEKQGVLSALTDTSFEKPVRDFIQTNWREAFMHASPLETLRQQINDPRLSWQENPSSHLELGVPYLIMKHQEKNLALRFSIAFEPSKYIFNGQKPFTNEAAILQATRELIADADAAIKAFRPLSEHLKMELMLSPAPKELLRVRTSTVSYQFRKVNAAPAVCSQTHSYRAKVSSWEDAAEWVRQRRKIPKETEASRQI
jgi:hypothetical protein